MNYTKLNQNTMEELNGSHVQLNIAGAVFFGIFNHNYTSFNVGSIGSFNPNCFEVEVIHGCHILHQIKL
jgi:hypothetical protein